MKHCQYFSKYLKRWNMADNWYWFQFSLRYGKNHKCQKKCENSVLCENIKIQFGKIIFSFEWQLFDIATAPLCFRKIITNDILIWKCRKKTFKQKVESAGIKHYYMVLSIPVCRWPVFADPYIMIHHQQYRLPA